MRATSAASLLFRCEAIDCSISLRGCSSSSPPTLAASVRFGSILAGPLLASRARRASRSFWCFLSWAGVMGAILARQAPPALASSKGSSPCRLRRTAHHLRRVVALAPEL